MRTDIGVQPRVRHEMWALVAGLLLWIPSGASATELALPEGIGCPDAIRQRLETWRALDQLRRVAGRPSDVARYVWPTARIGVWLDLRINKSGHIWLARVAPDRTTELTWSSDCLAEVREIPSHGERTADARAFTDADLERLVAASQSAVVYVWSPHMPLSVEGVHQASVAAQRLGVRLVPLADPRADPSYVNRVAREASLPNEAARPVHSIELAFRDMLVHAPSLMLFIDGRAAGPAIPGYRDADGYEKALRHQLEEKRRDQP